jgi:alpha/beta superfamily hydrolase
MESPKLYESLYQPPSTPITEVFHMFDSDKKAIIHPPENALHYNMAWKCVITPIALAILPLVALATLIGGAVYCIFNQMSPKDLIARTLGLPALRLNKKVLDKEREKINPFSKQVWITTKDGIKLNGIKIQHKESPKKWIIYMNGNNGSYETNYASIRPMSEELKANILCVNYRGVGQSHGYCSSSKNIILDGEAMVQYLIDQGVEQEDIVIYGYSLGGGVGAQVVAMPKFSNVRFISDRSFSSLYIAIKTFFWIPIYKEIIALLVQKNWGDLDSFTAVKNLGNRLKIIVTPQDYLIGFHEASLYYAFIKNNITPPHTLSVIFKEISDRCCFFRCRDLAKTHYWDLPKTVFPHFTKDLFAN